MNRKIIILGIFFCLIIFSACQKQEQSEQTSVNVEQTAQPSISPPVPSSSPDTAISTEDAEKKANQIMQSMTLEEKIGQMFIVNFELLDDSQGSYYNFNHITDKMKENLAQYHIGGVIFFSRNIETREQTTSFISDLQKNSKLPLFISVDEEGGEVSRIADNNNMQTTKFPTMQEMGAKGDVNAVKTMGETIAKDIKQFGFNLDFAPVADVKMNDENTEIGTRSFGSDPELVSNLVVNELEGIQSQNICGALKHFPGHGSVSGDTHVGPVNVDKSLMKMREEDLVPFKKGIDAGVDFVMTSHLSVSKVTENTVPASLSSVIINDILRNELNFKGITITDAMNMKAITGSYDAEKAAVMAVEAGNDIVLMPEKMDEAYQGIIKAVNNGEITENQINESVLRILTIKIKREILS